jgi:hypothetical protein
VLLEHLPELRGNAVIGHRVLRLLVESDQVHAGQRVAARTALLLPAQLSCCPHSSPAARTALLLSAQPLADFSGIEHQSSVCAHMEHGRR